MAQSEIRAVLVEFALCLASFPDQIIASRRLVNRATLRPMRRIRLDDLEVPPEERTFLSKLENLGPEYEFEITLREEEWVAHAVEHIKVFVVDHKTFTGPFLGYLVKTIGDMFKTWAEDRLKRAPQKIEKLTIYGPDSKPVKTIRVKANSTDA